MNARVTSFDFWFAIGSTYTYLTVQRLPKIQQESGFRATWRPFGLRALMREMNNVPFVGKPVKEKYMWRDFQRRAERIGIGVNVPVPYPLQNFNRANRVAIVARQEGWCEHYVGAAYHYWMQEGLPAGDEANLVRCMQRTGQSLERVLEVSESEAIEREYRAATDEARLLGIFGSPSFIVAGRELFWGDDRLEDAVDYWRRMSAAD